ncbi:uncharacterized protein TNCV_1529951 [Trichonephila clavipes]|uniref:Uncharacterized protein n=1 Tax=Trichonephila clavipes TaxID=2585209 RepID=A0A8X6SI06_TRICX|nr:uncharacterized protein TNCV_1529951 [Trichonephila clavipes]
MSTRDLYGAGLTGGPPVARSPKPTRRLDMTGGFGMSQSSPPVTTKIYPSASISQPPSARASPVSGRPSTSPSRKGRHFGVSRSSNSSPLTLPTLADPGMAMPHSYSSSGFVADGYYGMPEEPLMDARGLLHRSRSTTRTPFRSTYHILDRDPDRDMAGIGRDR